MVALKPLSLTAIILLAITIEGKAQSSRPSEAGTQIYYAYLDCLTNATRQLDDHHSDASTVAQAIAPMCLAEFQRHVTFEGRFLNPNARRIFERRVSELQFQTALQVVLHNRQTSN